MRLIESSSTGIPTNLALTWNSGSDVSNQPVVATDASGDSSTSWGWRPWRGFGWRHNYYYNFRPSYHWNLYNPGYHPYYTYGAPYYGNVWYGPGSPYFGCRYYYYPRYY